MEGHPQRMVKLAETYEELQGLLPKSVCKRCSANKVGAVLGDTLLLYLPFPFLF